MSLDLFKDIITTLPLSESCLEIRKATNDNKLLITIRKDDPSIKGVSIRLNVFDMDKLLNVLNEYNKTLVRVPSEI